MRTAAGVTDVPAQIESSPVISLFAALLVCWPRDCTRHCERRRNEDARFRRRDDADADALNFLVVMVAFGTKRTSSGPCLPPGRRRVGRQPPEEFNQPESGQR